jgi:16S rRNA G966 N2-methylase RsmD
MKFDIIFMDPPYKKNIIPPLLTGIEEILNKDGILVVEHDIRDVLPERVGNTVNYRRKNYGDTVISLYKIAED